MPGSLRDYSVMHATATTTDLLESLRHLTLEEVEQRLADVEAEREALTVIRRAIAVRERSKQRAKRIAEGRHDG